jgi:hypothetical protein
MTLRQFSAGRRYITAPSSEQAPRAAKLRAWGRVRKPHNSITARPWRPSLQDEDHAAFPPGRRPRAHLMRPSPLFRTADPRRRRPGYLCCGGHRTRWARILVLVGSAKPAADHLGPVKPAALGRGMEYRRHHPTEPTAAPSVFPLVPCAPLRPPPCGSQGAPEPQYSAGSPVISQPGHDRHGLHKQ